MAWQSPPPSDPLGSRGIVRRGLYALAVFDRFGVTPSASSRLRQAIKLLRALNDEETDIRDSHVLARTASAQRTIWEFFVIAYVIELRRKRAHQVFTIEKLGLALSGAELEDTDQNHLHRNTQFELYVAALLATGGAEVRSGEPDSILTIGPKRYGVAVKRMNSLSTAKIEKRLLEGANQIAHNTGEGYIAVNVDVYFRGHGLPSIEEEIHRLFSEKVGLVQSAYLKHFGPLKHVRGVIIYGHMSAWDVACDPPRYSTTYPTSYQLFQDDERPEDYERESAFWSGYTARLTREFAHLYSSDFKGP